MQDSLDRYRLAKRITLIGALSNVSLGLLKLIGGFFSHSHALVADGIHSFSDLISDLMVLLAAKYGNQEADSSHPYGHQRIETAAMLMLALLLVLAGAGIAWDAISEMLKNTPLTRGWLALSIAVLSILLNEVMFYYTYQVGKRIQSPLIEANAWHHRTDSAASLVVALGIFAAIMGFGYFDAIAAIIVGAMIIKVGVNYAWQSIKELIDTAVSPELLAKMVEIIQNVNGVEAVHQLRSRFMGKDIYIDVHILVAPYISVSEGHFIAQHVHKALMENIEGVKDVLIHVDPEDDQETCPSIHLPSRVELEKDFLKNLQKQHSFLSDWTIHYLEGKLLIDLIGNAAPSEWEALGKIIQQAIARYPFAISLRFLNLQAFVIEKEEAKKHDTSSRILH
ncbi:MAG: cation transporter [Legionella sp.]|nr:cation transporter [Legionella sp.]